MPDANFNLGLKTFEKVQKIQVNGILDFTQDKFLDSLFFIFSYFWDILKFFKCRMQISILV
jgi:hypothetical protein